MQVHGSGIPRAVVCAWGSGGSNGTVLEVGADRGSGGPRWALLGPSGSRRLRRLAGCTGEPSAHPS